jgi:hypothetical protein
VQRLGKVRAFGGLVFGAVVVEEQSCYMRVVGGFDCHSFEGWRKRWIELWKDLEMVLHLLAGLVEKCLRVGLRQGD